MKTKIRSIIIICAIGLFGALNTNAKSSYKTSGIDGTLEELKNVKSENLNSAEFIFDADAEIDYQKEAQLVTKWIADQEEEKTIQMLFGKRKPKSEEVTDSFTGEAKSEHMNSVENMLIMEADAVIDYQKEAQLVTKWVADLTEAKAIQKLIDERKLPENK